MLQEVFNTYNKILTVEDGTVVGGFGSAVAEFMVNHNYKADIKMLGIPDTIIEHGTPKQLYKEVGIDAESIADMIRELDRIEIKNTLSKT